MILVKINKNIHFHLSIDFQLTHGHRINVIPFTNLVNYILLNIFSCICKFNIFTFEHFKCLARYPRNTSKQTLLSIKITLVSNKCTILVNHVPLNMSQPFVNLAFSYPFQLKVKLKRVRCS